MQINIEDLITNWFNNAQPQEKLEFLQKLLNGIEKKQQEQVKPTKIPLKRKPNQRIPIKVLGKTFNSMKAAADHFGIAYHTVQYRRERGQSIEEIYREAYDESKKTKVMRRNPDGSIGVATVGNG